MICILLQYTFFITASNVSFCNISEHENNHSLHFAFLSIYSLPVCLSVYFYLSIFLCMYVCMGARVCVILDTCIIVFLEGTSDF